MVVCYQLTTSGTNTQTDRQTYTHTDFTQLKILIAWQFRDIEEFTK